MLTKIITLVITGRKQEKDIDKDNDIDKEIDNRVIKNNSLRGLNNLVVRTDLVEGIIHWNSGFVKWVLGLFTLYLQTWNWGVSKRIGLGRKLTALWLAF